MPKVKIIPCSGIGKVLGLIARESVLQVTTKLSPDNTETVCLAHIVTGDDSAREKIEGRSCITVDGCPALCAAKSVEASGGVIKAKYRIVDEMRKHKGKNAGTATELTEEGWQISDGLAEEISAKAAELTGEEKSNA